MKSFAEEIKYIEDEINNLKTSYLKVASEVKVITDTVDVQFSLEHIPHYPYATSTKIAEVAVTTTDGNNALCTLTLDATGDAAGYDLSGRTITNSPRSRGSVNTFDVYVTSANSDDIDTLDGGGSITLNYTMTVTCSSAFTTEVTYRDNNIM